MTSDDDPKAPAAPTLHDEALRHYGRRFFAEAQSQSAQEDAELDAWKREQRKRWPLSALTGSDTAAPAKGDGDPDKSR
jgi:hypothetical protein